MLRMVVGAFVLSLGLTACAPLGLPEATVRGPDPSLIFSPAVGKPGARLTVSGAGFPPSEIIRIYLGEAHSEPAGDPLATVTAADGGFTTQLTLPERWLNGAPISQSALVLVAANDDFSVKAVAELTFRPVWVPDGHTSKMKLTDFSPEAEAAW